MVLFKMLFQIAMVQLLGFLMKSSGMMPASTEWGISAYLGRVALPSLLFSALARLEYGTLDPIILTAVLIASLTIWFLAAGLGLLITRRSESLGERQMMCALMALFVTMGDDIGTGFPVLSVMSFRPDLVPLVFITAALGSLTTAPMGYALLAVGGANIEALHSGGAVDAKHLILQTVRKLRSNVLVISCLVGLAYNVLFGNSLPWYVGDVIDTIGQPFLPLVFFLAGMSSIGSFGSFGSLEGVVRTPPAPGSNAMERHGTPWNAMERHGTPWNAMERRLHLDRPRAQEALARHGVASRDPQASRPSRCALSLALPRDSPFSWSSSSRSYWRC